MEEIYHQDRVRLKPYALALTASNFVELTVLVIGNDQLAVKETHARHVLKLVIVEQISPSSLAAKASVKSSSSTSIATCRRGWGERYSCSRIERTVMLAWTLPLTEKATLTAT